MKRTERRSWRRQRGTQIVEFAVVLPILLFLVMAVTEGASFVRAHQVLSNAAREAARTAAAPENMNGWDNSAPPQNSWAIQAACDYLHSNSGAFPSWNAAADPTCTTFAVQVTLLEPVDAPKLANGVAMSSSKAVVTYHFPLQMFPALPWVGLPNPLPLSGTAQFRNYY